ncbi:protein-L-isoaspartate O-methyltransferase [Lysobacter hankyongensis]|uniref:Protein-L-isoaspartate O-methyltransferase n=1 Tax=Lysobacter hankyongensis TaxID=1176535 RepID=A0ABP9C530_9GAMM
MTIDYAKARETMVEQQVRPWDVFDARVLETLARLPRERFVVEAHRALAYADLALPIGHGESMMKPVLEGRTLQALSIAAGEDVLEIGVGSGYLSACLGSLARDVVGLELHADLAETARQRLQAQGIGNVRIDVADAFAWDGERRFDAICVGGAVATVPVHFLKWLRPGGRMFLVHGRAPAMEAALVKPADNAAGFEIESLFETELPYLVGGAPIPQFHL